MMIDVTDLDDFEEGVDEFSRLADTTAAAAMMDDAGQFFPYSLRRNVPLDMNP
jgi:hypothetical protein